MMKASDNSTIIKPAEILPPKNMNTENVELYTVHPYRVYQFFKPGLDLAINTYKHRRFPCNDGWCQDRMYKLVYFYKQYLDLFH